MADTAAYNYENLEPKYRAIAETELNEIPERVNAHIGSLRRWLLQCRHIANCPTDDHFLLRFLRIAKFNQERAQARLENYCTIRGSPERGLPQFFKTPALDDPRIEKVLAMGIQIPLGHNERGERIVLLRMGNFEPEVMSLEEARPVMMMCVEAIIASEQSYIAGTHAIIDFGTMTRQKIELLFSRKTAKENARLFQDAFALRLKGFHYYREPLIFDVFFKMFSIWLQPKIVSRIHRVKDDIEKLYECCPGAKQLLPEEYGGLAGPLSEVKARWIQYFYDYWRDRPYVAPIVVDESKRPPDSLKYLKQYNDFQGEGCGGTQGTYTKIDAL